MAHNSESNKSLQHSDILEGFREIAARFRMVRTAISHVADACARKAEEQDRRVKELSTALADHKEIINDLVTVNKKEYETLQEIKHRDELVRQDEWDEKADRLEQQRNEEACRFRRELEESVEDRMRDPEKLDRLAVEWNKRQADELKQQQANRDAKEMFDVMGSYVTRGLG